MEGVVTKPTQRELAQHLQAMAPDDHKLPGWVTKAAERKTRSDKGQKQEETSWFHKLIKPFKSFKRYAWRPGDSWIARNNNGAWKRPNGSYLHYGLGAGTSDGIGFKCVKITPEMVGAQVAVFVAIEAKRDGEELTTEQAIFLKAVRDCGGIAMTAMPMNEREVIDMLVRR